MLHDLFNYDTHISNLLSDRNYKDGEIHNIIVSSTGIIQVVSIDFRIF